MIQMDEQLAPPAPTAELAGQDGRLAGLPPQLALYLALAAGLVVVLLAWHAMAKRAAK